MSDAHDATLGESGAAILAANEVFVCRASGEGSHNFRVCTEEAGVIAFYDEMFGKDHDGTLDSAIKHLRDEDNWSDACTAYHRELYCATFEVWKVDRSEIAFAPSETALKGPGTLYARMEAVHRIAEQYCGHSPTSSEPPELAIERALSARTETAPSFNQWWASCSDDFKASNKEESLKMAWYSARAALVSAPSAIAEKRVPADLWDEIVEFIDDYVDVRDGSDGQPVPNTAMHLSSRIDREVK